MRWLAFLPVTAALATAGMMQTHVMATMLIKAAFRTDLRPVPYRVTGLLCARRLQSSQPWLYCAMWCQEGPRWIQPEIDMQYVVNVVVSTITSAALRTRWRHDPLQAYALSAQHTGLRACCSTRMPVPLRWILRDRLKVHYDMTLVVLEHC